MSNQDAEPWFADSAKPFKGSEPFFYDTRNFPWVARVESQWTVVRDELLASIALDETMLTPYIDGTMTSRPNQWKTLGLMFWTRRSRENCRRFPRIWALLRDVPGIIAISLNLLDADTTIKPHIGNTNAIIRCHLGLVIPEPAPRCGFRVGSDTRSWNEGEFLMFCDAHPHTAWNNSDRKRYILVLDVMRPEFMRTKLATSSRVLAAINFEAALRDSTLYRRIFSGKRRQAVGFAMFRIAYYLALAAHGLVNAITDRLGRRSAQTQAAQARVSTTPDRRSTQNG
jgi:aspartyl/asparaginyl beta-hydroxylase (cupin superfamily)